MNEIVLNRQSWLSDLGQGKLQNVAEQISAADEDALYDGFVEHCKSLEGVELSAMTAADRPVLGSSAPMLVPGTRLFLKIKPSISETLSKALELALLLLMIRPAHLGLHEVAGAGAAMIVQWLRSASMLSVEEQDVVSAVLRAQKKTGKAYPAATEVAAELKANNLNHVDVMTRLEKRGVLSQASGGWHVTL